MFIPTVFPLKHPCLSRWGHHRFQTQYDNNLLLQKSTGCFQGRGSSRAGDLALLLPQWGAAGGSPSEVTQLPFSRTYNHHCSSLLPPHALILQEELKPIPKKGADNCLHPAKPVTSQNRCPPWTSQYPQQRGRREKVENVASHSNRGETKSTQDLPTHLDYELELLGQRQLRGLQKRAGPML